MKAGCPPVEVPVELVGEIAFRFSPGNVDGGVSRWPVLNGPIWGYPVDGRPEYFCTGGSSGGGGS